MKEIKYFAFSTDADRKLQNLSDKDFRCVMCAVYEKLRYDVDPDFENYLLFDYYDRVLKTPAFYASRFDGRSITSAENGKKGGRYLKNSEEQPKETLDEHNEQVRNTQQGKRKALVYERICEEPFKYCEGASWEDITRDFDDITPYPDRLRKALQSLQEDGLIYFNNEGSKVIIKQVGVASLKKSE